MAQPQQVKDVMSTNVVALSKDASINDAARAMSDKNIGSVVVVEDGGKLYGIVTDRDLVVRGLAQSLEPQSTRLEQVCSADVAQLRPDDRVDDAIRLMGEKAIRRVPVIDKGKPIGIVSLGDLAVERDRSSALGTISAAPANR